MLDPVSEIVSLLQPRAPFSKKIEGAKNWGLRRDQVDRPYFAIVLEGACRLVIDGGLPIDLAKGDFVLVPSASKFLLCGLGDFGENIDETETVVTPFECRIGDAFGAPDVTLLTGYCSFASPDVDVLLALLPHWIHVRNDPRLAALVQLVGDEVGIERPARNVVLGRLLELLFIEALRSSASVMAAPSLLRGLADERIAKALRSMHDVPQQKWTVEMLARGSSLSRSAFFERFQNVVGVSPMEYLMAWRMALAKRYLGDKTTSLGEIAEKVGYSSANSFSIAFTRRFGVPPTQYTERHLGNAAPESDFRRAPQLGGDLPTVSQALRPPL